MKKRKKRILKLSLIIIFILVIIFILTILLFSSYIPYSDNNKIQDNTVTRIIDGDTFELSSGETVRLLCIDTPEKNTEGFESAAIFLENSILNKQVRLENLTQDKDQYNRLLRFVYVNNSDNNNEIFINKEIITQGYGTLFVYNDTDCDVLK